MDWPSRAGLSAEAQQAELIATMDAAKARNLNTIILQVRPTADTFWPSQYEPWSQYLTGTQGKDPGYDPLGFAVEQAHARGLELHAWMNPYPVAGKVFDDSAAYAAYGNGLSLADWRRANINALIDDIREGAHRLRPGTQFGVSPSGVWRNQATDPAGSATQAGVQTYDDLAADTRMWLREGKVDYMLPQVYWSKTLAVASYVNVVDWWAQEAAQTNKANLYVGEANYKVNANFDKAWLDPAEMTSHLAYTDQVDARYGSDVVKGHVFYNATTFAKNELGHMDLVQQQHYVKPALTPTMPWLDDQAPVAPKVTRDGGTLSIQGPADAEQYVIYRVAKKAKDVTSCDLADTRNVVAIVGADTTTWTDPDVTGAYGHYTWLVSAVDRGSNESRAFVVR